MREFRGDGGRGESATNNKADLDFNRVDWKGSSEREANSITINMRTDRKEVRGEHRGGGGGGENREVMGSGGRRVESRSAGGGDISGSGVRERKSSDDLLRMNSSSAQQETSQEVRESWGSRPFLKSCSSQASLPTVIAAGPVAATHGGEEEGEIGEFTDGGGGEPNTTRFEETKRKRGDERGGDPRGGVSSHNNSNNNNNNSTVTEREERQRDKSERRGGDLQVHISFVPPSQQLHLQRDKQREEKSAEREKEKEPSNGKQKDKAKEKEESPLVKEKGGSGNKESEVDSSRRGDKENVGDGYNNCNQRKEAAADQEEKDEKSFSPFAAERGVENRGGVSISMADFDHFESSAGTSAGAGGGGGGGGNKNAQQEENSSKVRGERQTEVKERGAPAEIKEQHHETKAKIVLAVEDVEKEKGKRKLRDYDRAAGGGGGDDTANNNADGEDFEREVVSSYGIQRKRLLRPRYQGSSTREVRPRFRVKDPESYNPARATAENSTLVYRTGEGLQEELRRTRKEFEDRNGKLTAEQQQQQCGLVLSAPTIEVRIPAELATTSNRQVQGSQLWGTDVYTDDSDLVAILMHTGYYAPTPSSPAPTILELRATVRVLAPQERYTSTLRNSLRSRAWGAASGCAFSVDSCYLVKKDGAKVQLEPRLTLNPAFAPTLAPAVTERTVTTRAVSMNAYRAQRFVQEVTIQYNLCNEPWLKYSMNIVADKGLKKPQYTSARLKKNDVLYVETHFHRYELSYEDSSKIVAAPAEMTKAQLEKGKEKAETADKGLEKVGEKGPIQGVSSKEVAAGNNHNNGPVVGDKYRWALCKWPLSLQSMRAKGVPLPLEFVTVLESGLGWEEVQWSPAGVCVRGNEYPLARAHFVPMHE